MSRRESLQKAHRELAARDKRRMVAVAATAGLALLLFVTLEFTNKKPAPAEVQDAINDHQSLALATVNHELLAGVRDATLSEQVELEADASAHLAANARTLLPSILQRLGEPAFPFTELATRTNELRGELFRMRGTVIEAGLRTRGVGAAPEYWTVLRSDGGHEAVHVSVIEPSRRYQPGDWVLADGYYLKRHSLPVGAERRTLPLFFGCTIQASVPRAEPAQSPDLGLLSSVVDPPMGVESSPDMDATWHLSNVAMTLREDPEALDAAFADTPWLSPELLAKFNETPEAYRGAAVRVGGSVFHGSRRVTAENPVRTPFLSEGWLRNSNYGEYPILVRTPGRFDWEKVLSAWEFRGWFQQMWAYEDSELNEKGQGNWRRVPLIVFADARPIRAEAPPFAGQIVWVVFGMLVLLGAVLFTMVMRDRARARQAEEQLLNRRQKRRQV
ncbi:MAG: hypothetical protein O3A20_07620 [Planctomycetota bacterium]|nr:hypothetical protein [Planctomycetota bacterium]